MQTLTDIDFIEFVGKQESQYIIKASEILEDVLIRLNNGDAIAGDKLPWNKTHNKVRLRPGEVSLWFAYNGHGKSQILGQICSSCLHNTKWLIASMEMPPAATMARMNRQVSGNSLPADDFVKNFMSWTDNRLWIYDQNDSVQPERILGMVNYAAQELGINHIVIDSLMKCGIGSDDYNKQKDFVDRLCWTAKSNKVHIHLVHHARKGINEFTRPGKYDAKGAGEVIDLVDNIFIIHRNKKKEEARRFDEEAESNAPDATLTVDKQRHGEWEGTFNLWFHKPSMQYIPTDTDRPMAFRGMN